VTSYRFPWVTALFVVPSTALAALVLVRGLFGLAAIIGVPTVVWLGSLFLRRNEVAGAMRLLAVMLSLIVTFWIGMGIWMFAHLGDALA